jgi:hypothetical protein
MDLLLTKDRSPKAGLVESSRSQGEAKRQRCCLLVLPLILNQQRELSDDRESRWPGRGKVNLLVDYGQQAIS